MKKAKIMLLTIAVLATVGTALAFKVKKNGTTSYCYIEGTQIPNPLACIKTKEEATAARVSGTQFYYTSTTNLAACGTLACTSTGLNFED